MMFNGAELGGATGAMAPLVFWSRSLKKSRNQSIIVLSGTSCFYLRSAPMRILIFYIGNLLCDVYLEDMHELQFLVEFYEGAFDRNL